MGHLDSWVHLGQLVTEEHQELQEILDSLERLDNRDQKVHLDSPASLVHRVFQVTEVNLVLLD